MTEDKLVICDSCLGMGNLEPETEEGDYEKCGDCNGTGIEQNDPFEGYHGPNADDGTKMPAQPSRRDYMSVDRNFRVSIHDGDA